MTELRWVLLGAAALVLAMGVVWTLQSGNHTSHHAANSPHAEVAPARLNRMDPTMLRVNRGELVPAVRGGADDTDAPADAQPKAVEPAAE